MKILWWLLASWFFRFFHAQYLYLLCFASGEKNYGTRYFHHFTNSCVLIGSVSPLTSLFSYTVTGTSFEEQNQPDYTPDYAPLSWPSSYQHQAADKYCGQLANSSWATACNAVVPVNPFYQACLYDVATSYEIQKMQSSYLAYTLACQLGEVMLSDDGMYFLILIIILFLIW